MEVSPEVEKKVQELQMLEQQYNQFLMQKQTHQVELSEAENALREVTNTTGDVYKTVGNIMVQVKREDALKDIEEKKKMATLRLQTLEKQEKLFEDRSENLRKELNDLVGKKK